MKQKIDALVDKAIKIMTKSGDVLHDEGHVKRMLEDWNTLSGQIKEKVNCDAVVLAICWHDTWLATHELKGVLGMIWEYMREGRGSANMFKKAAKEVGLGSDLIDLVADAIKNHPSLPGNKQETIEAKVLWDVDNLEAWSYPRLAKMIEKIGQTIDKKNAKKIKMAKIYWNLILKNRSAYGLKFRLYFDWSRKEFTRRKIKFVEKIRLLELRYGKLELT